MIGILWGLAGAGLIGVSDCVARVTAQRVSLPILLLVIMGAGFLALGPILWAAGRLPEWHAYGWAAAVGSGLLNLVALAFLFLALARGPVTVASPTASSFTIMLVGINGLAGHAVAPLQAVAAMVVFGGIVMLARRGRGGEAEAHHDAAWLRTTALLALGAALAVAVRMFLAQEAAEAIGELETVLLTRGFAVAGILLFIVARRRSAPLVWPDRRTLPLVLLQAALEILALGAFLFGSAGEGRVGAAIGFSVFPAVTALTAWIWLGEPIGLRRAIWMGVVAGGVGLGILAAPGL